ncbi:hypothetical protein BGX28_000853 [Mortierella sp. GBA30]|nr:hypothetical protein BGX28_000853 [Mortierella sp. GBA30]
MNSLVSYASDSESELDESILPQPVPGSALVASSVGHSSTHQSAPLHDPGHKVHNDASSDDITMTSAVSEGASDGENDFVSAALKDLQSFAATVDTSIEVPEMLSKESTTADASLINPTDMDVDQETVKDDAPDSTVTKDAILLPPRAPVELTLEQQAIFDAFMQQINDIPLTTKDQSLPPPISLHPNSSTSAKYLEDTTNSATSEMQWQQSASIQAIYSRMHHLSLLSSPKVDPKELEDRLIEFAIRILDWEQRGMKPAYFLGEERAQFLLKREAVTASNQDRSRSEDGSDAEDEDDVEDDQDTTNTLPPPYGGVVAEMLELMSRTEQSAAPNGWKVVFNAAENSYGFQHLESGILSSTYPAVKQDQVPVQLPPT